MTRAEWVKDLPKMDLHCHLDGCIHRDRIEDYLKSKGEAVPQPLEPLLTAPEDCPSLTEYLRCFDLPLRWLQCKEGLTQSVIDLLRDAKADGCRYIEIRFAPSLHLEEGLSYDQVFEALEEGKRLGEAETGVICLFIVCAMRHHSQSLNLAMLEAAAKQHPQLVCAADLAGDENAFPTRQHMEFFLRAKELGIPFTIHSGETGNCENITAALELGAARLGHGIAMHDKPQLMADCRSMGVGVELCPSSNFQTKASQGWQDYPLQTYLKEQLCVSLNTDNRTVSGTDLSREYLRAMEEGGCTPQQVKELLKNGCLMSFAPEQVKADYLAALEQVDWNI